MIDPEHYDCGIEPEEAQRIERERRRQREQEKARIAMTSSREGASQLEARHFPPGARDAFNSRFRSD